MHETCPHCGKVIVGESYELKRLMQAHIKAEHEQGYRRLDSWGKCHYCNGRGKDVWGITCKYCNGSGIE